MSATSTKEATSQREMLKMYYPDKVNVLEPFDIRIEFLNIEIAKQYEYVRVYGCTIPFEYQIGLKKYPYSIENNNGNYKIKYSGEEKMDLPLSFLKEGHILEENKCTIEMKEYSDYTSPNYTAAKSLWDHAVRIESPVIEINAYDFGINNMPSSFVQSTQSEAYNKKELISEFRKKNEVEEILLQTDLIGIRGYQAGKFYTYKELLDIKSILDHIGAKNVESQKNKELKELEINGDKGFIYEGCTRTILGKEETYDKKEVFNTKCFYAGVLVTKYGPLKIYGYADTLKSLDSVNALDSKEDEWKNLFISALENHYFKNEGNNGLELEDKKDEDEIKLKIYGTIKDGLSRPMPYVTYVVEVKDKKFEGIADENGKFSMPITDMEFKESETEIPAKLTVDFIYDRNDKKYFAIKSLEAYTRNYAVSNLIKPKLVIKDFKDLEVNIDFSENFDPQDTKSQVRLDELKHLSVVYYHSHEAVNFMIEKINANIDHNLPVDILVGNTADKTLFSPPSRILISATDAAISSTNRPDNREYHEWAHFLMWSEYKTWPEDRMKANTKNHDGFFNPSTADSYMEGFAEFMAMVMSDYYGEEKPEMYAGFGSMENDYKPWDGSGFYEELAVASLLWDMYDSLNEDGDRLTLLTDEMWKVLKVKKANFYEYYKAFKKEYPEKEKIDNLFAKHGFFIDTRKGNGKYDNGEPWKYLRGDSGDWIFIDLSGNYSEIKYNDTLTLGTATNYERLNRTNAVVIPESFLLVNDDSVDFYKVIIEFKNKNLNYEYVVYQADKKVYVSPLPSGVDAKITLVPLSTKYTSNKPFSINSKEWNSLLSERTSKGYLAEHNFELKDTGKEEEHIYETFSDVQPNYIYKGDLGEEVDFKINDGNSGSGLGIWVWILIIIILGGLMVLYVKNPKFKKGVRENSKKAVDTSKKSLKKFKEKGIPVIKKGVTKTSKELVKFSKKAYDKTSSSLRKKNK